MRHVRLPKALAIAGVNVRLLLRDRTNLLFVFVLPLLVVFVLGAVTGGWEPRLGLVVEDDRDALAVELADAIAEVEGLTVRRFDAEGDALAQLRRDELDGLLVIPAGHGEALASGATSTLRYAASPDEGFQLRGMLDDVIALQSARVRAALVAAELDGADFEVAAGIAGGLQAAGASTVTVVDPEGAAWEAQEDQMSQPASQQLVLFTFLTALTVGAALIRTRELGITRRMLATPTPAATIVVGEVGGRYLITVGQGVFIAVATTVLFGVEWGSWTATIALIVVFSAAGVAAATLLGVTMRNEQQAGGVAMVLGIGLGALGGSMFPLELFPDAVRVVAHLTPHAWANDAFSVIIGSGGGLTDVLVELAVLAAYGAVLLVLAGVLLRSRLSRAGPGR